MGGQLGAPAVVNIVSDITAVKGQVSCITFGPPNWRKACFAGVIQPIAMEQIRIFDRMSDRE